MRGLSSTFLLLVLLAAAASPASGQIVYEQITVHLTSEEFLAEFRGDHYSVSDSQWLRAMIDNEHGNDDGEVTQEEVDAYVESQKEEINAQLASIGGAYLFNGIRVGEDEEQSRSSVTREITDVRFNDAVLGPVDRDEAVIGELDARLTFADTPRSRILVVFADDFRRPFENENLLIEWEEAVFRGGGPWEIDPDTVEPERVLEAYFADGAFTVTYDDMGQFSSSEEPLTFEIVNTDQEELGGGDKKRSPAPGLLAVIACIGLAALMTRRARRA